MKTQTISIIGLGRTGLSVGLAIKQSKLAVTVIGHDKDDLRGKQAKEMGAIDRPERFLVPAVSSGDIVVVAVPAQEVSKVLAASGRDVQAHALFLNLSSGKVAGQKLAEQWLKQGHYVGGSLVLAPAGLTDGRPDNQSANPNLFKNSLFCLMPSPKTEPKAIETATNLGVVLGASPFFLDPAEFDSLAQGSETLPGLMAAVIFRAITKAAGWRDMLKFANAPFALATLALQQEAQIAHLALQDKTATLRWLDAIADELREVRQWVYEGDQERLAALLEQLNLERDSWLAKRTNNNWNEQNLTPFEPLSLTEQLIGRRKKDDGRKA